MNSISLRVSSLIAPLLAIIFVSAIAYPAAALNYTAKLLQPAGYTSSEANGNTDLIQAGHLATGSARHATIWSGTAASAVDIHPAAYLNSTINGASGNYQVGEASGVNTTGNNHAILWNGTAASAVDLHPATGFTTSTATGVDGTLQVGWGAPQSGGLSLSHAILWHGTAASAVDLNPPGYLHSFAEDVYGNIQAGWAQADVISSMRAFTWTGTAASGTDVTPPSFTSASIRGMWQTNMVGSGAGTPTGNQTHALLWTDTTPSNVIDLHPAGYTRSEAFEVFGPYQVGMARGPSTANLDHAFVWNGSAATAFDLHALVQAIDPTLVHSMATSVSENGDIVGRAFKANNVPIAVLWTPVPEPAACYLVACSLIAAAPATIRRRAKKIAL